MSHWVVQATAHGICARCDRKFRSGQQIILAPTGEVTHERCNFRPAQVFQVEQL